VIQSLAHRYPDFGSPQNTPTPESDLPDDALEEIQLASFDAGYQAGWEDAAKAQASSADKAVEDVAQNLQDLSFSHREAYLKLSASMRPVLTQIVEKLLPKAARTFVGIHLVDQIAMLMDEHAETAIEIVVAAENVEQLQVLLNDTVQVPFAIVSEPALACGQAYLRVGQTEREINLDAVLSGISEAVEAFYEHTSKEMLND